MSVSDQDTLEKELKKHYGWYDHGTRAWSTAHRATLFLVPILTAAATVLLKAHWASEEVQIVPTTAATVLASIAASQGFAKKCKPIASAGAGSISFLSK
jgi:ribulose-5-phosphate 4-epimerase/fuculose-1-phosphate aldolase